MTREQIEEAAFKYQKDIRDDIGAKWGRLGFIAGAESRQPEIDNLTNSISLILNTNRDSFVDGCKSRQPEIDELKERISRLEATLDIEVNYVQPKMKAKIDELVESMRLIQEKTMFQSSWYAHEVGIIVDEILKKYESWT